MSPPGGDRIKDWKHFERLAAALQAKLDPGAQVVGSAWYDGKLNGGKRQIDASVFGTLGSAKVWIAIDAKRLVDKVDVPEVEKFAAEIRDVGAHRGIMITTIGYSAAALTAGARERIDTCILRPARDEDWDGLVRAFDIRVRLVSTCFHDEGATLTLQDGREVPCTQQSWVRDRDGELVGLPELVEASMAKAPPGWEDGTVVTLGYEPGAFDVILGDDELPLRSITCRPYRSSEDWTRMLIQSPHDFVFLKMLPDEQFDERRFFEFEELDRLAETFRKDE